MSNTISCETHGRTSATYLCIHLAVEDAVGLGFNGDEPTSEKPHPDAWCDDCEIIREARGGWNEKSEGLVKIVVICSGCYARSRIRNTRPSVTLGDLADLRWKCGSCEEWHTGPCLDFGYRHPYYWLDKHEEENNRSTLLPWKKKKATFLDDDYCAIEDRDFFIRGLIHLPIIGAAETFRWGVWGSLSRENFDKARAARDDSRRVELPLMFSWLSSQIPEYPDTLSVKMHVRLQEVGTVPYFILERTDHPLSQEYHCGVTPERVKEIMLQRLRDADSTDA